MDCEHDHTPARRGLRPGQVLAGSFRKGDDARRPGGLKLYDGQTLAQIARKHTPECVALMARCVSDEEQRMTDRLRAAELLLDRGWGKAVISVDVNITAGRELKSLTREELIALANGVTPRVPITIDGEAQLVEQPSEADGEAPERSGLAVKQAVRTQGGGSNA